jgi:mannosyl-glycoprotein endo-beta-N-acetylglucosaminidase
MWEYVDIFVYFSHACVAPPPPAWVDAAHRHGVRVLGTVLTEWDAGVLENEAMLRFVLTD